jgi:hypothetical protein
LRARRDVLPAMRLGEVGGVVRHADGDPSTDTRHSPGARSSG